MQQDIIYEITRKAIEAPKALTEAALQQSKKLRTVSPKAERIGRVIGFYLGLALIALAGFYLLVGRPEWAVGPLVVGIINTVSHAVSHFWPKK